MKTGGWRTRSVLERYAIVSQSDICLAIRISLQGFKLVPGGGIEPPQGFWPLRILSPLRLPISPSRPVAQF
jgi:hypothetical protein